MKRSTQLHHELAVLYQGYRGVNVPVNSHTQNLWRAILAAEAAEAEGN